MWSASARNRCHLIGVLLLLMCASACELKPKSEWDQERFDRMVAEVKAGQNDTIQIYDLENADALLHSIVGLPGVRRFVVEPSAITDAGIADIATLPDLMNVIFVRVAVTRRWLELLKACPNLQEIEIGFPRPLDISALLELPHLRKLRLIEVHQSSVLPALESATQLDEIEFGDDFAANKAELIELQEKLPKCKITVLIRQGGKETPVLVRDLPTPGSRPADEQQ